MVRTGGEIVIIPLAPSIRPSANGSTSRSSYAPMANEWTASARAESCAARIVRRVARRAGIGKPNEPHTLRQAFITAALDASVPLRDVQEAASHADPRTTTRYDRARVSLDRHAAYIAGAGR